VQALGGLGLASLHGTVLWFGHGCNGLVVVALFEMYSKCGLYEYARKVFDRIQQPSVFE
uniref:Uncharacterized protein n=1 Tax=Aegilops tauschii subsp. strangulata TaxID=200361 RepID=A0A453T8I5_AEGTS